MGVMRLLWDRIRILINCREINDKLEKCCERKQLQFGKESHIIKQEDLNAEQQASDPWQICRKIHLGRSQTKLKLKGQACRKTSIVTA